LRELEFASSVVLLLLALEHLHHAPGIVLVFGTHGKIGKDCDLERLDKLEDEQSSFSPFRKQRLVDPNHAYDFPGPFQLLTRGMP
jgi:hypothetical protein